MVRLEKPNISSFFLASGRALRGCQTDYAMIFFALGHCKFGGGENEGAKMIERPMSP